MNVAIPFVGPSYKVRSASINAQRCVNLYLEPGGPDGKSPAALLRTPGLRVVLTMPNAPAEIRDMCKFKKTLIVVSGDTVYSVDRDFKITEVGKLGTIAGPVAIISSTNQYIIVDGVTGWVYDLPSNVFAQISSEAFPKGARMVSYLDGMAVVEAPNSAQFSFSKIGDFRVWDGLDFASTEGAPDNIVGHITSHRDIWFLGDDTSEVWTNTEGGLARAGAAFMEVGCAAPFSPCKADNSVFWIGKDENGQGVVWRAQDFRPVRVSDFGVEYALSTYRRIDDARGFVYQQEGHLFYVLMFPSADATWVYDIATGAWHERASWNETTGTFHRHRANCHEFFAGLNLVGDYENGSVYAFDLNEYTDNGAPLVALRTTPALSNQQMQVFYSSLQIDIESGIGLTDGQGSEPKLMMRYSDDSARTWSNRREASMGKMGEYCTRVRFNRLGRGRNRVWEITVSDPVKVVITGAFCTMEAGNA